MNADGDTLLRQKLLDQIQGYRSTCVITAALQLGLIERLGAAPAGSDVLARDLRAHPLSLKRFLRALSALGLVELRRDGDAALTGQGRLLLKGSPLHDRAVLAGEQYLPAWAGLKHSLTTGEPAFHHVFGMGAWEHRRQHPHLNEAFNRTMTADHTGGAPALGSIAELASGGLVVDVGGGHGHLLASVLAAHPKARGMLFDLPHVVAGAAAVLAKAGVAERCEIVGGSFLEAVPAGGDVYILQHILHDWDDDRCGAILRHCRAAMKPSGTLLVVEHLVPEGGTMPAGVALLDLHMMAVLGGRERTQGEFEGLLRLAGLHPKVCTRAGATLHVLRAGAAAGPTGHGEA